MLIAFTIPGPPVPKGRPRFSQGRVHTPKKTKDYEKHVQSCANAALLMHAGRTGKPWPGQREMDVRCTFHVAGKRRGDIDNLLKAILDGCNGILFDDDRLVVSVEARILSTDALPMTCVQVVPVALGSRHE